MYNNTYILSNIESEIEGKVLYLTEKGMKEFEELHEFFKKIV